MTHRSRATPARLLRAVLLAAALTTTACSVVTIGRSDMAPTITRDEAHQRADAYIAEVVAALTPTPTLDLIGRGIVYCKVGKPNGDGDRISVGHRYFLNGLSTDLDDVDGYIDFLLNFWTSRGYRLYRDDRPVDRALVMENPQDKFLIGLQVGDTGDMSIAVDSPCIWPNGTPTG